MEPGKDLAPDLIFDTITAYQNSYALATAIDLDLFSKTSQEGMTAAGLADACGTSERGMRILADTVTILGFLEKDGDRYTSSPVSAKFLDKSSPAYFGGVAKFMMNPTLIEGFSKFGDAVRTGSTPVSEEGTTGPEDPIWVDFAKNMMAMMMPSAMAISDALGYEQDREFKVLDVAASHGIFGIMIGQKYPNSQIYGLDWKNVLPVAVENAGRFGVGDRYHTIEGSVFDVDLGSGYDVVLLPNFLHHFNPAENTELIRRLGESMTPDGQIVTLEFIPNEDRISPRGEAMFAAVMLATTPEGDAYTFADLDKMFSDAGFTNNRQISMPPMPQHIVISKRS